ncbi:MAG: cobalamin biosynthesis protein CobQ [Candidatus Levybacteria bacterium]|nr:cobalamin biosynthesis protein CobQ [Candidatus Levybacteria bacterium]
MNLTIGWLYPELMSTYGDRGNIIFLKKRCEWRGINTEILNLNDGFDAMLLKKVDILFMGGAQDVQQKIVAKDLNARKVKSLKEKIQNNTPGLYICGAFQFLGKYYKDANGKAILGLSIFDLYTENPGLDSPRLIGNIVAKTEKHNIVLVGFENHGGRTYLGKTLRPFARVIKGFGNNGKDKTEGAIYKNSIGTYLHGPILPKNPEIADWLIEKAIEKKYRKKIKLETLDDFISQKAREYILEQLINL